MTCLCAEHEEDRDELLHLLTDDTIAPLKRLDTAIAWLQAPVQPYVRPVTKSKRGAIE